MKKLNLAMAIFCVATIATPAISMAAATQKVNAPATKININHTHPGKTAAAVAFFHATDVWVENHSSYPITYSSTGGTYVLQSGGADELWYNPIQYTGYNVAVYNSAGALIFNGLVPNQQTLICKDVAYGPGNQTCYVA